MCHYWLVGSDWKRRRRYDLIQHHPLPTRLAPIRAFERAPDRARQLLYRKAASRSIKGLSAEEEGSGKTKREIIAGITGSR